MSTKSTQLVHHRGNDGTVFKTVSEELENARTLGEAAAAGPTPATSTDTAVALWDGTTGRLLKSLASFLYSGLVLTLKGAGNAGIELGRIDGNASTPYIDFHSGATAQDYDARIIASGGGASAGLGTLDFEAATLQKGGANFFDGVAPTTTRGDIITRGASGNQRVALGANGTSLQSNGTDAVWAAQGGIDTIASGSLSGATLTLTSIAATYNHLILHLSGASCDTATRSLQIQLSTDNGSTWDTTAGNYPSYVANSSTGAITNNGAASLLMASNIAAATTCSVELKLFGYQGNAFPYCPAIITYSTGIPYFQVKTHYVGSTTAINALKVFWNGSGSFDAGTYALYGVK